MPGFLLRSIYWKQTPRPSTSRMRPSVCGMKFTKHEYSSKRIPYTVHAGRSNRREKLLKLRMYIGDEALLFDGVSIVVL